MPPPHPQQLKPLVSHGAMVVCHLDGRWFLQEPVCKEVQSQKDKNLKKSFPELFGFCRPLPVSVPSPSFFLNVCVDFNEIIPLIFGRYQLVCSNVHLFYKQKAFSDVWYHNKQYCFSLICSSRPDKQCLCNNSSIMQNDCDTACCIKKYSTKTIFELWPPVPWHYLTKWARN